MKTKAVFINAYLLAGLILKSTASYVNLTDNGYQDVVVNLAESATGLDCHETVRLVQDAVREMSNSFERGLDDAAVWFNTVTIVIPKEWSEIPECSDLIDDKVPTPKWVRTYKADVNIVPDHSVFGAQPYSFQYGRCGQPSLPINLPLTLLTDVDVTARGKKLAREWAHYRYGVFDEGGVPDDIRHPSGYSVYQTDGSVIAEPNICSNSNSFNGKLNNDSCPDVAAPGCELVLDRDGNPDISSSIMYRPDLSQMDRFCTKETHNRAAPSKQNYFCNGLSAVEVIYQHDDFKSMISPSDEPKEVSFNVIRDPFLGYHIIIDTVSFDDTTFLQVRNSITSFVSLLPIGFSISIDSFDSQKRYEVQERVVIVDDTTRDLVLVNLSHVNRNVGIANGFIEALQNARAKVDQDVIIVTGLTSAPDNGKFELVLEQLLNEKVNVHLLCFQIKSSVSVPIAQLTRYGSFHVIPNLNSDDWANSLVWAVNTLQSIYSTTYVHRAKVFEKTTQLVDTNPMHGTFYLESDVSRLIVCVYSLDDETLELLGGSFWFKETNWTLTSRDVNQYGVILTFKSPDEKAPIRKGLWQYEIQPGKKNKAVKTRLDIWVESDDSSADFIKLRTWNSASDNQILDWSENAIGIYAQLTQNRKPITGANVVATVYVADNNGNSIRSQEILLKDEGLADVTSGDGIYSGWISNISTTSVTYSIHYTAYGVQGLAQVDSGKYDRAPTTPGSIPMTSPISAATQFNRFGCGPSFLVNRRATKYVDNIPPQRITDLVVDSYDATTGQFLLTWSCPLDDFGSGEYVKYFVVSQSIGSGEEEVISDTTSQYDIKEGKVSWSVQLPDVKAYGTYIHYVVQGQDASRNLGNKSNIVSLYRPDFSGLSTTAWVFIGLAIALLLIFIVVLLFLWLCPSKAVSIRQKSWKLRDKKKNQHETIEVAEWTNGWRKEENVTVATATIPEERHYFGQQDIDSIKSSLDERGTEEMITSVPSIDLQLSNIIRDNSSALNLYEESRSEAKNSSVYATPFKHGTASVASNNDHQISMPSSASGIFYTDIPIHTSASNSVAMNYDIQHEYASPIYADPRLDGNLQLRNSTFDPKTHPANQLGLPKSDRRGPRQKAPRQESEV